MTKQETKTQIWNVFQLFYPNFSGGAIQAIPLMRKLEESGYRISILAIATQAAKPLARKKMVVDGLEVQYVPAIDVYSWTMFQKILPVKRLFRYINVLLKNLFFNLNIARVFLSSGSPGDIAQFYSIDHFTFLALWAARTRGMKSTLQLTLMGSDDPGSFQRFPDALLKMQAFHKADAIIPISTALMKSCQAVNLPPAKLHLIPNGVNIEQYSPLNSIDKGALRQKLGLEISRDYLLFVGSAIHRKGIDILIHSFVDIAAERENVNLLIIGQYQFDSDPGFVSEDQQLINELMFVLDKNGLSDRVTWLGYVESNLQEYYQVVDLFVFPTRREGLPNAITLALAAGLPVIAGELDGITTDQIQQGENGYLIREQSADSYVTVIEEILSDEAVCSELSKSARLKAIKQFDLDLIVRKYVELYQTLE